MKNFYFGKPVLQFPGYFQAFVLRAVIYDDDFKMQRF
jgi:hypothetical protein